MNWIKLNVEDLEPYTTYTFTDGELVFNGFFTHKKEFQITEELGIPHGKLTHYQPRPKPPH